MVLNNINKNDSILLEVLASVFTVSSNFTDNPRTHRQKLSNITIFRRHSVGSCKMEYVGNGIQIFGILM